MAHLPRLAAEQQLAAIEAASMPHMKEHVYARVMKRLTQRTRRDRQRHRTAAEALATLPIPVVYEPAKGGES